MRFLDMKEQLNTDSAAFCVYGNDNWVKKKAVANICSFFGVTDDGFSVDKLEDPSPSDVVLSCSTPSMFCEKKIVVVDNFSALEGGKPADGKQKQNAKRLLSDLLAKADGSFCLVIVAGDDKPYEGIVRLEKVDCNRLEQADVVKWISAYCKRKGFAVDRYLAEKISDYCLRDMARVSVETQKLLDYGEVTDESVDLLVHRDAEYMVFDLSKHIGAKNASKALETYRGLIGSGEDARALFGLLYNFYRRAYYVKISALTDEELSSYLGVKSAAVGFAKKAALGYKPMQLKRALDIFVRADELLKAFADENEVMTQLILQLTAI